MPTNSQAPKLFWLYRLVGFGAVAGSVYLGRNRSGGLGAIDPAWAKRFASYPTETLRLIEKDLESNMKTQWPARTGSIARNLRVRHMRNRVEMLRALRFELSLREGLSAERYHETPR